MELMGRALKRGSGSLRVLGAASGVYERAAGGVVDRVS